MGNSRNRRTQEVNPHPHHISRTHRLLQQRARRERERRDWELVAGRLAPVAPVRHTSRWAR